MLDNHELKSAAAQQRPHHKLAFKAIPAKSPPDWKPEPCGLTREELRNIVAEILG